MKIKVTSLYVDDQDKALRFYTEVLGFAKKTDFSQGPFRWLTVASPEEPDGTELQLALNNNPAAKAYQQAIFQQGQPAAMFFTDDIKGDYERIKARGAEFTMPPTDVTGSTIAMLNDTCGNLIQLTQLARWCTLGKEKKMTDREQYTPGPASGAQIRKDRGQNGEEKWTLILVRELRHSPEKVWQALTDPAHLREWAPFDADGSLGTVGTTVKLTTVGAPTPRITETTVTRADAPKVLEYNWGTSICGGNSKPRWWRHAADAVDQHRSPLHRHGCCRVAHLFRCSGSPAQRNSHRPHGRPRGDEVRRLAAAERGVRQAVRY